jgi:putative protein kinase ArgK-like GTPase of G3E family
MADVKELLSGNKRAIARTISAIENNAGAAVLELPRNYWRRITKWA